MSACGNDESGSDDSVVTGLQWVGFQGIDIPVGDQGPHRGDAVAPQQFDRSPAGAALAAMSGTVRMSVATDEQWTQVGQLLVANPARDAWAVARSQISIAQAVQSGQAPVLLAYEVTDYSDTAATVAIYSRMSDKSLTKNTVHVLWTAGDWRVDLPAGGAGSPVVAVDDVPDTAHELTRE